MSMISAHRAGALEAGLPEASWDSLMYATGLPVEYVEFDVHRFSDGVFFLDHPTGARIPRL